MKYVISESRRMYLFVFLYSLFQSFELWHQFFDRFSFFLDFLNSIILEMYDFIQSHFNENQIKMRKINLLTRTPIILNSGIICGMQRRRADLKCISFCPIEELSVSLFSFDVGSKFLFNLPEETTMYNTLNNFCIIC